MNNFFEETMRRLVPLSDQDMALAKEYFSPLAIP